MSTETNPVARKIARAMLWLARIFFFVTIVLIPFRLRWLILARPAPPVYKDFTDFLLFGSDVPLLALLACWGGALLLGKRVVRLGPKFLYLPMLGLILTSFATSFTSLDSEISLYHSLRLVILFLFYLYIVTEVQSKALVISAIAIQVAVQSIVSLAQFFLQSSVGLGALGEHDLDPTVRGVSIVSTGVTRVLRSYGLTEHPNIVGGCIALGLIIFLAIFLHGRHGVKLSASILTLICLPALFVTFSRSAWLAFIIGTAVLFGASTRDRKKLHTFIWLALMGGLIVSPLICKYSSYIGARFNVGNSFVNNPYENRSVFERLLLDEMGIQIFLDKPWTGVGLGASALGIYKYFPEFIGSFVPPHLVPLAIAMELGLFGLGSYLCLSLMPWILLIKKKIILRDKPVLLAASILLGIITFIGLLDIYPWSLQPGRLWQWLIWGIWAVAYEARESNRGIEQSSG